MKKILLSVLLSASLYAQGDIRIFDIENSDGKITAEVVEESLKSNGFTIGVNSEMNRPFTKQFGKSDFKSFNLLTAYHTKLSPKLVSKYPNMGLFIPISIGVYQASNENSLHVAVLTSETQSKISGVKDNDLKLIEKDLTNAVKKMAPNATQRYSAESIKTEKPLITIRQTSTQKGAKPSELKEEFEASFESAFEPKGFVMPAYMNIVDEMSKNKKLKNPYDFYVTYSICKLEVIYNVTKTKPEASAFAPCTTIAYKKKSENKINVAFPSVYNWLSSAIIKDEEAIRVLNKAQNDFENVLQEISE